MHPIRTADSTVKTTVAAAQVDSNSLLSGPVELDLETLEQVGGGLAPRGTWGETDAVEAPRGTW